MKILLIPGLTLPEFSAEDVARIRLDRDLGELFDFACRSLLHRRFSLGVCGAPVLAMHDCISRRRQNGHQFCRKSSCIDHSRPATWRRLGRLFAGGCERRAALYYRAVSADDEGGLP